MVLGSVQGDVRTFGQLARACVSPASGTIVNLASMQVARAMYYVWAAQCACVSPAYVVQFYIQNDISIVT